VRLSSGVPGSKTRRVPLTTPSAKALAKLQKAVDNPGTKAPNPLLCTTLEGLTTDWARAKKIAASILDPKYTLKMFHEDLAAFPELHLFQFEEAQGGTGTGDEYQKTIGTFFAMYWLLRMDLDGKDGFSNGVDDQWAPMGSSDSRLTFQEKRAAFQSGANWTGFKKVLMDAGLLETAAATGKVQVNEHRLVLFFAMTSIRNIMKITPVLPKVQKEHAPYRGYKEDETIGDRDHALTYVMDLFPSLLPSFRDLSPDDKESVEFMHSNIGFNHGWFVQAEAPPGAVFSKLTEATRRTVARRSQGRAGAAASASKTPMKIGSKEVALYLVRWLIDLASAEPTPLSGSDKFSTKFSLPVLNSFLRSFEFVGRIASETETQVMESYIKSRWEESALPIGPAPTDSAAIAKMRLCCMAQMNAVAVLRGFEELPAGDQAVLSLEMSRTGCVGQQYSKGLVPSAAFEKDKGPAFLVYYGPAFLQNLEQDSAAMRLKILAEVYRGALALWPATEQMADGNVTIRIDIIKSMSTKDLLASCASGDAYMLVKHNEVEAFVEKCSAERQSELQETDSKFHKLTFGVANCN